MGPIKTILAPTDFSSQSAEAVGYAAALAKDLGARIILLHVIEQPIMPTVYYPPLHVPGTGPLTESGPLAEALAARIKNLAADLQRSGLEAEGRMAEGHPVEEICVAAKELGVDLIVMGTHGRGMINRLLLGSVTEKVIRTSPVPVLTASPRAFSTEERSVVHSRGK